MTDPYLFPTMLYGERDAVRRAWSKVARKAWKTADWDAALQGVEYASVWELPGDILLRRGSFGTGVRHDETLWRPYLVSQTAKMAYRGPYSDELRDHSARVFFGGMEKFAWFTVGMLEYETGVVPSPSGGTKELRIFFEQFLRAYVKWLPEIYALADRYADEANTTEEFVQRRRFGWAGNIIRSVHVSGAGAMPDSLDDVPRVVKESYGGDLPAWLVDRGVIERVGSRFKVRGPPS